MYFLFLFLFSLSSSVHYTIFYGRAINMRYEMNRCVQDMNAIGFFYISFCNVRKYKINRNQAIGIYSGVKIDFAKFSDSCLIFNFYCEFFILGARVALIIGPSINCNLELLLDTRFMGMFTEDRTTHFAGISKSAKI